MRGAQLFNGHRMGRAIFAAALTLVVTSGASRPALAEWAVDTFFTIPFPKGGETELDRGAANSFGADGDVDLDVGFGLRVGYYFPIVPHFDLGVSVESAGILGELGAEDYNIVPTTAAATFRFPLLIDKAFPHGRLQPYVGVGPSAVWSEIQQQVFSDSAIDIGADTRAGLNFMILENFGVYAEYRFLYFKSDFEDTSEAGVRGHIDVTSYTHMPTIGITWRFDSLQF